MDFNCLEGQSINLIMRLMILWTSYLALTQAEWNSFEQAFPFEFSPFCHYHNLGELWMSTSWLHALYIVCTIWQVSLPTGWPSWIYGSPLSLMWSLGPVKRIDVTFRAGRKIWFDFSIVLCVS